MRVGIITVYYSENCGSLLQALSLQKKINELGHEVVFINTKSKYSSHSLKLLFGRIIRESLKLNFSNVKNTIGKYHNFKKDINKFKVINFKDIKNKNVDLIVVGSDTVWDYERDFFKEYRNVFFPKIDSIPVVSYAASVGNTRFEAFKNDDYTIDAFKSMKEITVRDDHSKSVLTKLLDEDITMVADPTIMIGKDGFKEFISDIKEKKYLLIYSFNDFDEITVNQIKKFANDKNLTIISFGNKYSWSDKNVISSLKTFITYYNFAEYVITNTFHGTVFSIIFNKQFVNIDFDKKKVDKLLEHYNLSDRTYKKGKNNITDIFSKNIDYSKVNKLLEQDRIESNKVIDNFFNMNNIKNS